MVLKNFLRWFGIFALILGFAFPQVSVARMDYTSGSGMTEGDPGDGNENPFGGSNGGSDLPDDLHLENIGPIFIGDVRFFDNFSFKMVIPMEMNIQHSDPDYFDLGQGLSGGRK